MKDQNDRYIVYYRQGNYLPVFLIADILLLFMACIALMSPYVNKGAVIAVMAVLVSFAIWLIMKLKSEKGKEYPLLEITKEGILDCNPAAPKGFISWEDVQDAQIYTGTRGNTALVLTMKDKNTLHLNKKEYISLSFANNRPEYILDKVQEYRKKAGRS